MDTLLKKAFEDRLLGLKLLFHIDGDGMYIISRIALEPSIKRVLFICSMPVDVNTYGSRNGNVLHAIGCFRIDSQDEFYDMDFIIFSFQNSKSCDIEYVIIPSKELQRRVKSVEPRLSKKKSVILTFWLMTDRNLYETNGISPEGEWYYLSKGLHSGRMADKTEMCYTKFLNNWSTLIEDFGKQSKSG